MTFVLGASTQQKVAGAVVVVLVLGWLFYLWGTAKRTYEPGSEIEQAPNRTGGLSDDVLEGPRLERFLGWALALLAIAAIGLPAYWLREPVRQKGTGFDRGIKYFNIESVQRGEREFQATPGTPPTPRAPHYGCENCHGVKGIGGSASYTLSDPANPTAPPRQVQWLAPALNTVMLRYRPEEVKTIITYGRAGTPMPPWGVAGGGALNDQQIEDLVSYLDSIKLKPAEVMKKAEADYGTDGAKIFEGSCARCHTLGFSYGDPGVAGGGAFGPNLTGGSTTRQFPTQALHIEWVTNTAAVGQKYGVRGISKGYMPFFGQMLTPEQIKAVVDYERSL